MNAIEKLLHFLLLVAVGIGLTIYGGAVFAAFWGWFIVPLGVPDIKTAHAVGLVYLVSLCLSGISIKLGKMTADESFSFEGAWKSVVTGFVLYSISWVFGWVTNLFM